MSFLKTKLSKVFGKPRAISPCLVAKTCAQFCCREIHEPQFECCFATRQKKDTVGNNGQKKRSFKCKRRKSKSPKILSNRSVKLNDSLYRPTGNCAKFDLLLNANRMLNKSIYSSEQSLCDKFDQIGITEMTPRLTKLYPRIPEHDKKILNRMAMKRKEEIARLEDASIAQKYWDKERSYRDFMVTAHNEQFLNAVKMKRVQDTVETEMRLRDIAAKEQNYLDRIKEHIVLKNQRLMQRLRQSKLNEEIQKCERRERDLKKYESALVQQHESELNNEIRKQQCFLQLENRISRADAIRNHFLAAYKRRLLADNRVQQDLHAINYEWTKRLEDYKLDQLKQQIRERDRKTEKFNIRKQKMLDESREQARATAELRDIIRRSISPENHSYRGFHVRNIVPDRPLSNLSFQFQSHVKLG